MQLEVSEMPVSCWLLWVTADLAALRLPEQLQCFPDTGPLSPVLVPGPDWTFRPHMELFVSAVRASKGGGVTTLGSVPASELKVLLQNLLRGEAVVKVG